MKHDVTFEKAERTTNIDGRFLNVLVLISY